MTEGELKAAAARMLGRRAMSEGELIKKLTEKGADETQARFAAAWLTDLGALDDVGYARAAAHRLRARGYGDYRVACELKRRLLPPEVIEEIMGEGAQDQSLIDREIEKRMRGKENDLQQLKKLSDALYRRGFGWDEINTAIKRYSEETD